MLHPLLQVTPISSPNEQHLAGDGAATEGLVGYWLPGESAPSVHWGTPCNTSTLPQCSLQKTRRIQGRLQGRRRRAAGRDQLRPLPMLQPNLARGRGNSCHLQTKLKNFSSSSYITTPCSAFMFRKEKNNWTCYLNAVYPILLLPYCLQSSLVLYPTAQLRLLLSRLPHY